MKTFAKIISVLFHPIFMPFLTILIVFNTNTYLSNFALEAKLKIYFIFLFFTVLMPLIMIAILLKTKQIKSIYLETKEERRFPYLFIIITYFALYYLLIKLQLPIYLSIFILGILIATIIGLIINTFWKISTHMIGIGYISGLIFFIILNFNVSLTHFFLLLILVSGLIGTCRMYLKAHTLSQIFVGYIVGFLAIYFIYLI